MNKILITLFILIALKTSAQKVQTMYFNLYTDSLKKGVHNYINIDAKLTNGKYIPLEAKQVLFTSNYGSWQGNNLIIDSAYNKDSVVVTATLKADSTITQSITIFLKKNLATEKLKTQQQVLNELNNPQKKKSN